MQFHHHGYVSEDPRVAPAAGTGVDRPDDIPDEVDVLIVGSGPAGILLAAQLSQFPALTTRIVERRTGRLAIGHADGVQTRTVETFQAFGFAERIIAEAYRISETSFWAPDSADPSRIVRTARVEDDPQGISEFPHLVVNQARVIDYFAEAAANGAARIRPDYGTEFLGLDIPEKAEDPVVVRLRNIDGTESAVRARYVVGCDGARSRVRESIGREHVGRSAMHAWGVMDVLAVTDFPDVRLKSAIHSHAGSILLIPREGGYLLRLYVDLGEVGAEDAGMRDTPLGAIIARANEILAPYTLDVREVSWWSVYEVSHRITDKFDDVPPGIDREPRVFICGDACHTHSAKAGQGMNVSMQDGFNLGWKLASVLTGRAPVSLLRTYSAERRVVAEDLIDFDRQWSDLMARKPEDIGGPEEISDFYARAGEFFSGFLTRYSPSMIIGPGMHQSLASGFPIGKRFKSALVRRVADANPVHLGHHARADGRWRIYVFSDLDRSALESWARQVDADDDVFDVKVIFQQAHSDIEWENVPGLFTPRVGPHQLIDYERIYAVDPVDDIFHAREIDRRGVVVVVRPDQYVAEVLPLEDTTALAAFFDQSMVASRIVDMNRPHKAGHPSRAGA